MSVSLTPRPLGVPSIAVRYFYKSGPPNSVEANFYLWEFNGKWQWYALAKSGDGTNKEDAARQAREWIKSHRTVSSFTRVGGTRENDSDT